MVIIVSRETYPVRYSGRGMLLCMAVDFKTWVKQTENHFWDMDGSWGPQCWDLWAKYCMDEYGCSVQDCITPTGWAGGLYTHHPVSARVGEIFEKKTTHGALCPAT